MKLSEDTIDSSEEESLRTQPSVTKKTRPTKAVTSSPSTNYPSSPSRNADNEVFFELSKKRRVTVRRWRTTTLVDIREYWEDDGELKPGKKGISLSTDQWNALKDLIADIDDAIAQLK